MLLERTTALIQGLPQLRAAAWPASLDQGAQHLPSLHGTSLNAEEARQRAMNMTSLFRSLGARGHSPVEFQLTKAIAGELDYSRKSILVDFLLYAEVLTGLLIGFHDKDATGTEIHLGLAPDASEPTYEHITRRMVRLRSNEPVLMADRRIIGSLRHGPDYRTRVRPDTTEIWAVAFASPDESEEELSAIAEAIRDAGRELGVWTLPPSTA